jgi:hypothetical protein
VLLLAQKVCWAKLVLTVGKVERYLQALALHCRSSEHLESLFSALAEAEWVPLLSLLPPK